MRTLLLVLLASSAAVADGAFPNALQALTRPSDPQRIYLGTTFGVVFTEDTGATWRYVCEPYITGGSNVSLYALQADGALLAVSDKLTRSTDRGCTWATVAPPAAGAVWVDAFADPGDATRVLGVAWISGGSGVWISHDGGQTFPTKLLETTERVISVESAASDPNTIYAASAGTAVFRSTDGGANWQRSDVPGSLPLSVRILAVSPTDAKTLWLRASNPATDADNLLLSSDGGATFSTLLVSSRFFTGFAHAPDGTLYASDGNAGLLLQPPGNASFQRQAGPHLLCLALSGTRMLGCGDGLQDPFNLASSDDLGRSWRALLNFSQIQGPSTCPQVQTACAADWQYQQTVFAAYAPKKSGCASADAGALALLTAIASFLRRRGAAQGVGAE